MDIRTFLLLFVFSFTILCIVMSSLKLIEHFYQSELSTDVRAELNYKKALHLDKILYFIINDNIYVIFIIKHLYVE